MTSRNEATPHTCRFPAALLLWASACAPTYPPPPESARHEVVDTIHGERFVDPYRWLEDQESAETRVWIAAQNAYAEQIVDESERRSRLEARLRELMDVDEVSTLRKAGQWEYFTMRRASEEIATIYRRPAAPDGERAPVDPNADYERVVDPMGRSDDLTTKVDIVSVSKDGALLLYSVRHGGQDEIEVKLRDVESGNDLPDHLPNALYSSIFFSESGDGFYYTYRSRETGPRVRFHRLGAASDEDDELFGDGVDPRSFINTAEIAGGAYLLFTVRHGWARGELHLKPLRPDAPLRALASGHDARFDARYVGGRLLVRTSLEASNNRLVEIPLDATAPEHWREILPEREDVLQDFTVIDERLFGVYSRNVSTRIDIFDLDGSPIGNVDLPELSRASIRGAGPGKAFLTLESYLTPEATYLLDLETGARELWQDSKVPFEADGLEVKRVLVPSKDGTEVPMTLLHADDLERTGDAPTLLYGYGGFNAALAPNFDTVAAAWIENGGVFAVANLRGGSEFGETWHRAGMLENKQNVFDDFIASGEWLIDNGYTSAARLAIRGISNGGLLVAAAMTQRPDLFRAVSCGFPDLDMMRFNTFTETNNMPALLEYGDAGIAEQFAFLRKYSAYQAVADGTRYPAVFLASGDRDTRVPPLQARKMTAHLQAASTSGLPVILRYDDKAGHAARRGLPMTANIDALAFELSFLMTQLGVR